MKNISRRGAFVPLLKDFLEAALEADVDEHMQLKDPEKQGSFTILILCYKYFSMVVPFNLKTVLEGILLCSLLLKHQTGCFSQRLVFFQV